VHGGGVETGEPHVADDDDLQRIVGFLARSFSLLRTSFGFRCGWNAAGSVADPVITTLMRPASGSSLCQSGRSATILL